MSILLREASGFVVPGVVSPQVGSTEYQKAFGKITTFLGDNTSLYYNYLTSVSTIAKVTQTWTSERHAQNATLGQVKLPRYLITAQYSYNKIAQEVFEKNSNGISFKELQDNMCLQAIAQKIRIGALFGFGAGEGLFANASSFTFGNDPDSNSTAQTYNPAWFRNKILEMVRNLLNDVKGMTDRVVIFTSRRLDYLINISVVSLTESQKPGAGIDTIGGSIKRLVEDGFGIKCEVILDDTLENANSTQNKDLFVAIAPGFDMEVTQSGGVDGKINVVGQGTNSINYNTTFDIGAGGRTIEERYPVNYNGGGTFGGEHIARITSGYSLRPEAVIKAEITF